MDRAEQIKVHVDQQKEGKYHEQIKIPEDATGYSYGVLFKPYISSALAEVWVEDPYIRHIHQPPGGGVSLDLQFSSTIHDREI
ncbi:hypothetical protein CRUP_029782, partial [Coryphaenoides rupestris]